MIRKIKQELRERLTVRMGKQYGQMLDERVTTYDAWIREKIFPAFKERKEQEKQQSFFKESVKTNEKVRLLSYEDLCLKEKEIQTADQKTEASYVILTSKEVRVSKNSIEQIQRVFEENPQVDVIYGDEDEINHEETAYLNPWLKPDYSPHTLLSFFYFGSLFAVRSSVLKEAADTLREKKEKGKEEAAFGKEKDDGKEVVRGKRLLYAFALEICFGRKREQVYHIKGILSSSHSISYWGYEEEFEDIRQYYSSLQVRKKAEGVSIIIPSKDHPMVLERCIRSVVHWTKDITYEILVVDNGSCEENKEKIKKLQEKFPFSYFYEPMEFNFSKMCNLGAGQAKYDFLLFLNDDCEVRGAKWLGHMLSLASMDMTGVVGAKLYYPEKKQIQHCGIYQLHLGPVHKLQYKEDVRSYYDRRNLGVRNVLAVTAACLLTEKEKFLAVGGFDEQLKVAFNDVDICYRFFEAGYHNVVDNEIHLWHHESLSRGSDEDAKKLERLMLEKKKLYEKHARLWQQDPYYHPWFSTNLLDTGFSFAYEEADCHKMAVEIPMPLSALPKTTRIDPCVVAMIEYAGDLEGWFLKKERIKRIRERMQNRRVFYLQGSVAVLGSDNACYEKWLLLRHEETGKLYRICPQWQYRPDLVRNLADQRNVGLGGFSCLLDLSRMPEGEYRIGVLVMDKISKQYLLRITTRSIENGRNEL